MSLSVNVPPGFRFHPTEEELLHYYLKKKVSYERINLDVIRDVDLNKLEPWDIQEECKISSTPQNDWYFFSHKDKKYPTGTRTNRATAAGFWKATGRDKIIYSNSKRIGMRKTLVFYKGRAPHGQKSDWIMHEYRLDDNNSAAADTIVSNSLGEIVQEEGWVVCRVFRKKNHHKVLDNVSSSPATGNKAHIFSPSKGGALNQIIQYMSRSSKRESDSSGLSVPPFDERFVMQLPALESPTFLDHQQGSTSLVGYHLTDSETSTNLSPVCQTGTGLSDWDTLDRLVTSQLNGHHTGFNYDPSLMLYHGGSQDYHNDIDLWNFNQSPSSSSDPLCHLSNTSV